MRWRTLIPVFLAFGRIIAGELRRQDRNKTGADDEAANAIDAALTGVEAWQQARLDE